MVNQVNADQMKQFRVLRARKATYGFEAHLSENNFVALGRIVELAYQIDGDLKLELNINMGHREVKIYSNSNEINAYMLQNFVY